MSVGALQRRFSIASGLRNSESVSTVAELNVAEAVRCTAIVDKDVVRFNVYEIS